MKVYKIQISQRAFSSINECVLFVNAVSNLAAKDLYKEIMNSINSLKLLPNSYPNIEGLSIGGFNIKRMPIHKGRYIILYKINGDLITIYDIIDSRKDNSILKL